MLENHFVLAWRHIARNKVLSIINVFCLSTGFIAFTLIASYVHYEHSFDAFHSNATSIYRVGLKRYSNGELIDVSSKNFPGVRGLLKQTPGVEDFTGFYKTPANTGFLFRYRGKIYNQAGGWLNADSGFFKVFPSLLLHGDPSSALSKPNSIILSETVANSLFGKEDPVGQQLDRIDEHGDGSSFIVTGVIKEIPDNAHFHASVVEHINDTWPESETELWNDGASLYTYITLKKDVPPTVIEQSLNRSFARRAKNNPNIGDAQLFLQPITEIHLSSNVKDELEPNANKTLVYLIGLVGLIILIVAWMNYINIETSRFVSRLKQFGIRRIIGSTKRDLVVQSLVEYYCLVFAAIVLSGVTIFYLHPFFLSILDISFLSFDSITIYIWLVFVFILLLGSGIVGIIPAVFLIQFSPTETLKGKLSNTRPKGTIRNWLIGFQFSVSSILIGFVMVIDHQTTFMISSNNGLELEHVIAIRNVTAYSDQELTIKFQELERLQNSLLQNTAFKHVASSSAIPGSEIGFSYVNLIKRNLSDPYDPTVYKTIFASDQFLPTYDIQLVAGTNFSVSESYSGENPWDQDNFHNIILNERAV